MFSKKFLERGLRDGIEKKKIFAGLLVFFKGHSNAWMNENLVKIEKPKIVKEAEKYLSKRKQGYTDDETSYPTIQRTTLNKWTGGD